jgi:SAM-dependent methyltransferase
LRPSISIISARDPRLEWHGTTIELEGHLKGFDGTGGKGSCRFSSRATRIEIGFHAHAWSGIAEISVDGRKVGEIDLFNPETAVLRRFVIENHEGRERRIEIRPTGRRSDLSFWNQLLLEAIFENSATLETPVHSKTNAINRGGAFYPRFFEIMVELSPDAVILDVGGGKRQLPDERYINLEYSRFEEPDLFGDGTKLPFRSNSIDFVYTAAVLEHVADPLAMGREIHRVLKPGGKVLANSAFMQPIHCEGQHFFNLTPYGIDLTFSMFEERRVWWDTSLNLTLSWFIDVLGVRGRLQNEKIEQFLALGREISDAIPGERGKYVASSVWVEGVKK